MMYGGDHGELPYARVSSHVFICTGSNVTADALPRYTIHENRGPGPLDAVPAIGGRGKAAAAAGGAPRAAPAAAAPAVAAAGAGGVAAAAVFPLRPDAAAVAASPLAGACPRPRA